MQIRRAQSTVEYAVLGAVVVAALVGMQIYMKRGISGRLRASADAIGEPYSPKHTNGSFTMTQTGNTTSASSLRQKNATQAYDVLITTSTLTTPETTTQTGNMTVDGLSTEQLWE